MVTTLETMVLESITKECKDKKINTLVMNPVDYANLMNDWRRFQDIKQVLEEALQRNVIFSMSTQLVSGQFKWVKEIKGH